MGQTSVILFEFQIVAVQTPQQTAEVPYLIAVGFRFQLTVAAEQLTATELHQGIVHKTKSKTQDTHI